VAHRPAGELTVSAAGWCPRCDAVREAGDACPECRAALIPLDDRPRRAARPESEPAAAPDAVVEPPKGRLRVAAAVAAVVLVGLAFVAGRITGGTAVRAAPNATVASTATTLAPPAAGERRLGWKAQGKGGVSVEVVSITRTEDAGAPGQDLLGAGQGRDEGDSDSTLHLRVSGLEEGRRLLGIRGLRLGDSGGGVFADPDERQIGAESAVPALEDKGPGAYLVDLGSTPDLASLTSIDVDALVLSSSPAKGTRVELPAPGAWPARPPLRDVSPAERGLAVPVDLGSVKSNRDLQLQLGGVFVGGGRAVVVLGRDPDFAGDPGGVPLSASLLDADRVVCSRQTSIGGPGFGPGSPLLVVDCAMRPTARLAVRLAAGVDNLNLGARLHD
jgi:hypothetical protein